MIVFAFLFSLSCFIVSQPGGAQAVIDGPLLQQRQSSPQEMFELYGIDRVEQAGLVDGYAILGDEQGTLLRTLYRFPQLELDRIDSWLKKAPTWNELTTSPENHRYDFFSLRGRIKSLQAIELSEEQADRFDFARYFVAQLELADSDFPVEIYCRGVPECWVDLQQLDQQASASGLFLKTRDTSDGKTALLFAADRIAWHPDRLNPDLGIGPSQVLLGDLGADVGQFDLVRSTNREDLGYRDREAFYQILAATAKAQPNGLFERAEGPLDLEAALTKPETQHGRLISLQGTIRRVQKILVSDPDIRQRFGIDHYYRLDVFVPLGDAEVRLGRDRDGADAPVFVNSYPVTCCVLSLPDGLTAQEELAQDAQIVGFYFKLWAYRTAFVSSHTPKRQQLGPLLIATQPRLVEEADTRSSSWGWIAAAAFLACLGGILFALGLYRRSDRRFEQLFRNRLHHSASSQSLDTAKIDSREGPDFSSLDQ